MRVRETRHLYSGALNNWHAGLGWTGLGWAGLRHPQSSKNSAFPPPRPAACGNVECCREPGTRSFVFWSHFYLSLHHWNCCCCTTTDWCTAPAWLVALAWLILGINFISTLPRPQYHCSPQMLRYIYDRSKNNQGNLILCVVSGGRIHLYIITTKIIQ